MLPPVRETDQIDPDSALQEVLENLRSGNATRQRAAYHLLSRVAQTYLPEYLPRTIMLISEAKLLETKNSTGRISANDQTVDTNKLIAGAVGIWTEMTARLEEQMREQRTVKCDHSSQQLPSVHRFFRSLSVVGFVFRTSWVSSSKFGASREKSASM
jgi:hypothetical protein